MVTPSPRGAVSRAGPATHAVETILDYGCDWKYIVEVRDGEIWGDARRYGEMRGDMG